MMSRFIYFSLIPYLLCADGLKDIYNLYQSGKYKQACNKGLRIFNKYRKNSDFLMLYGFSCLKADYINRVAIPMIGLRKSKTARANASYFATVFLQKKLLLHALLDHTDISQLKLPVTDHIISKVFQLYVEKKYRKKDNLYIFQDPKDSEISYYLYTSKKYDIPIIVIEERKSKQLIKTHRYW